ncbi:MAG: Carbohydrate binding domain [Actinomycetota bacterium]|nr:Carbohydrate binding domain [Actinomycetota bacterium]
MRRHRPLRTLALIVSGSLVAAAGIATAVPAHTSDGSFPSRSVRSPLSGVQSDARTTVEDRVPVTLTFNLWNGVRVTYHVIRSGTSVTGTVT